MQKAMRIKQDYLAPSIAGEKIGAIVYQNLLVVVM
jgi:hypothetical protein